MRPQHLLLALLLIPLASAVTITAPTSDITAESLPTTVEATWSGNSSTYTATLSDDQATISQENLSATSTSYELGEGNYTLSVTGSNSSDETQFSVTQEQQLELGISADKQEYEVGETVELTATSNQPVSATLDILRDGSSQETYTVSIDGSVSLIYIPEKTGDFTARLEAQEKQTSTNWQVTKTEELVVDFTYTQPVVNKAAQFSASASGGVAPYTYQWLFSDDTASTGEETDHYFFEAGDHEATLIVTDDEGTQKSKTKSFTVEQQTYDVELTFQDQDKNFIKDLTVELLRNGTDQEDITDETGLARFSNLVRGNYTVRVTQLKKTYLNTTLEITKDTNKIYSIEYGTAVNTTEENATAQNQTQAPEPEEEPEEQVQQQQGPTAEELAQQQVEQAREEALTQLREKKFSLRLADKKDAALDHLDLYKRFDTATTSIEKASDEQAIQAALADVPTDVRISAETNTVSYPEPRDIKQDIETYLDAKGITQEKEREKYRYNINKHTSNVSIETKSYTATITYPDGEETHTIVEKEITSPPGSTHIEIIDKSFAQDVSKLRIEGEYDVLQADPVLRFTSDSYSYSAQVMAGEPGSTVVIPEVIEDKPLLAGLVTFELGASSLARTGFYLLILGLFVAGIVAGKKINEHREQQHLFEDFYELASTAVDLAANGQAAQAAELAPQISAIHEELPAQQRAQSADVVEHLQAQAAKHEFTTTVNETYQTVKEARGDINAISSAYEHALDAYEQLPEELQEEFQEHLGTLEKYLDGHIPT